MSRVKKTLFENHRKRDEVEKDLRKYRQEAQAAHRELTELRPAHEKLKADLDNVTIDRDFLKKDYEASVDTSARIAKKLSQLALSHELLRGEYLDYQTDAAKARVRLEALENIGREILQYLPTEAKGRAKYSRFAQLSVQFKEVLGATNAVLLRRGEWER